MSDLVKRGREYIAKMDPQQHRKMVLICLVIAVIAVSVGWSKLSRKNEGPPVLASKDTTPKELLPDSDLLAKTQIGESRKQVDEMNQKMADQQKILDEMRLQKGTETPTSLLPGVPLPSMPQVGAAEAARGRSGQPPMPLPPPSSPGSYQMQPQQQFAQMAPPEPPKPTFRRIGDIEMTSNPGAKESKDGKEAKEDKKKVPVKITLPSGSHMKAQLLNGVDAPIGGGGKSNPVPVLVRIQDIATLPSSIRMNLKGCFAICDGYGELSTSRANLQVRSISCLDRTGKAVIDQQVEGYLVDEDGKAGLKGITVWKGAEIVTRAAFAGFLQGVGSGVKAATASTNITPAGVTSLSSSAADIALGGAGQGIATAADEIQKMYMELVHQSLPVVSVGATKQVTLIILKKAELVLNEVTSAKGVLQ
jgi:conjugal transfer pilus assembly protein TraB